jgi:hypothetical protein
VDRILAERPGLGSAPLFQGPQDPTHPVPRRLVDKGLREAEKPAGLERMDGGLWHPWRRLWATSRKDLPAVDVARAGGWSTVRMVQGIYTRADQETTLSVVLHEPRAREAR